VSRPHAIAPTDGKNRCVTFPYERLTAIGTARRAAAVASNLQPAGVSPKCRIRDWMLAVLCAIASVVGPAAAADKVDVVQLKNGDRLTCEIKKLDQSVLSISTDPLGSASVHWGEIIGMTSPRTFDVQLASGAHYYGSLAAAPPGQLTLVSSAAAPITLAMADVIRIAPIGARVWSRIDGALDAGFSFAQANLETHYTLNGTATYRSPRYQLTGTLASQLTTSEDADRLSRNTVSVIGSRSFGNRWYTVGWASAQQNEELSLELRLVGGAGMGRDFVHTARRLWSTYVGLAYTHEQFADEPVDRSLEAAVGGQFNFFTPGKEDFKITNSVVSYYNISGRSRIRVELQSAWRHEFLKDFFWSVNGFDSFDSDPPDERKSNDSGVSLTLGWKF
jgi:hypothetical protein